MENQPSEQDKLIGQTLGNFEIVKPLGKGGMGRVYLATDRTLDRPVALKVMLHRLAADDSLVRRFNREAKAAAQLNHPNIVQVYAVGLQDGMPYIAMEYVQGITLDQLLRRQGRFDWHQALDVARQVSAALACAHGKGIIHRDIKPSNILMARDRRVRVADFGLAKLQAAESQLTSEGIFLGTPQYMSPEQCGVGDIVPASDLFSLGVVLYEMISGRRPFQGDTPAGLVRSITMDPAPPLAQLSPETPPPVTDMVMRLLSKTPASRPPSGAELIHEIDRVASLAATDTPTMPLSPQDAEALTEPWASPVSPQPSSSRPRRSPSPDPARGWLTWRNAAIALAVVAALVSVRVLTRRTGSPDRTRADVASNAETRIPPETGSGNVDMREPDSPPSPIIQQGVSVVPYTEKGVGLRLFAWLDGPECVLAHAIVGEPGDRVRGRNLFVTLNPVARLWRTVGGSLARPAPDAVAALRPKFYAPRVAPESPLHDAVVVLRPVRSGGVRSIHQELVAQRYDTLDQNPRVLFKADPMGLHTNDDEYFPGACHGVAFHPDGTRVCLIVSRGVSRPGLRSLPSMFLCERGLDGDGAGKAGPALTPAISGIRDVHYAPAGNLLAYERIRASGDELWVVQSGKSTASEGVRVVTARSTFAAVAFNPIRPSVLVSLRGKDAGESELILVDVSESSPEPQTFGPGHISEFPWDPTGAYFAASFLDDEGWLRVWAYQANGQGTPILLAEFPDVRAHVKASHGLSGPIVARDGRWVAVEVPGDPAKVAFIDLYTHPLAAGRS